MACGIAPHGPAKLVRTCRGCGCACRVWLYGPVRRQAIGRVECAISVFGCHRFRYRADHRSPTICAVFYSWFTCALCFGKWIPVHGAHRHPSCTHIQGGFFADGPFRRWDPDRVVALYLLARRICRGPISLCAPEKKRPLWYDSVEEVRSCRRWAELIQSGPGDRSAFDDGGTSRPAGCAVLRVLAGRTCAGEALAAVDRSVRRTRRAAAGTGAVLQSDGAAIG